VPYNLLKRPHQLLAAHQAEQLILNPTASCRTPTPACHLLLLLLSLQALPQHAVAMQHYGACARFLQAQLARTLVHGSHQLHRYCSHCSCRLQQLLLLLLLLRTVHQAQSHGQSEW
jgi:hypothetical protein